MGKVDPLSAGIHNPLWFINANNPNVFNDTVLPPVLEPVMSKIRYFVPNVMVVGTTTLGANIG